MPFYTPTDLAVPPCSGSAMVFGWCTGTIKLIMHTCEGVLKSHAFSLRTLLVTTCATVKTFNLYNYL